MCSCFLNFDFLLFSVHAKCFKCNKCGEQFPTQATYAAHRVTHNISSKKGLSFSCEICGKNLPNQLKFFEHLKAHYEPGSGALVVDPSNSANGLVAIENGSAHQKLSDSHVVSTLSNFHLAIFCVFIWSNCSLIF